MLHNGQTFPTLSFRAVGGGILTLPDDLAGAFGVVLVYRGSWCPFCNAQLAAFQRAGQRLDALEVTVAALSVDDEPTSKSLVAEHGLEFPVGHSADADTVSAATGAFTNPEPHHLQSTGFVLSRSGVVLTAVYATGAIGRLVPADVAGFVDHLSSQPG